MDRYGRQTRLAEVGPSGQAAIARAFVDVREERLAGEVAVRYLAGAGVGGLGVGDASLARAANEMVTGVRVQVRAERTVAEAVDLEDPRLDLRDATAREVARGALTALRALRAAIARAR